MRDFKTGCVQTKITANRATEALKKWFSMKDRQFGSRKHPEHTENPPRSAHADREQTTNVPMELERHSTGVSVALYNFLTIQYGGCFRSVRNLKLTVTCAVDKASHTRVNIKSRSANARNTPRFIKVLEEVLHSLTIDDNPIRV